MNQVIKIGLKSHNMVKAINTYAIPLLSYSFGIIKWSDTELQSLERKIRTLLTKNRMFHPKAAIERQVLPRMQGGRGITSIVWTHEKQVANIREYFRKQEEKSKLRRVIMKADNNLTVSNLRNTIENTKPEKKHYIEENRQRWRNKVLHGRYPSILRKEEINHSMSVL